MNSDGYPNFSFRLDDGRTIKVHAFIWEPSLPETRKAVTGEDIELFEIDRNRFKCSDVIRPTKTHVLDWDRLNKLPCNSSRFPNSTINVLLSSEPLSADALGVTACLYAYSHCSFSRDEDCGRLCARHYHWLREYMYEHAAVAEILGAID